MSTVQAGAAVEVRREEVALEAHRFLLRTGLAIGNVFAWVFIFEYFLAITNDIPRALSAVVLVYALAQFVTMVLTPLSAMHLRRGAKHSLVWGVVLAASAFVWLGATFAGSLGQGQAVWGVAVFAILLGAYRALYWIPFQLTLATSLPKHFRMKGVYEIVIALMPLFAGLTLLSIPFAPVRLLFGAAALILLSSFPILRLPDIPERFSWPYVYTFKQLLRQKHRSLVGTSLLDGLQGAALFLVWPLAVFLIVGFSYMTLGLVLSLTLLSILVLRAVYKRLLGSLRTEGSTTVQAVFAVSGWIVRLAAGTPLGVIFADAYFYTTAPTRGTSADPFVFEQSTDRGSFVDEYTALKEIALALGRIGLCVVVAILVLTVPLPIAFGIALVLAAISSGAAVYLARHAQTSAY